MFEQTVANYVVIRDCIMDQRCHTFSFGHYHQAPGASCCIYCISLFCLLSFLCNPNIPFLIYEIFHLLVIISSLTCWALWPCGCQSDMLGFVAVRLSV